jgi:hypothetical protein
VGALVGVYVVGQFLSATWFMGRFDRGVNVAAGSMVRGGRLGLLAVTVGVLAAAVWKSTVRWKWCGILAMVVVMAGQFAGEVSGLGVTGIWFPFGVGFSRTQFLYVGFFVVMFGWGWLRREMGEASSSSSLSFAAKR